jgi:hypothetical protein
MDSENEERMMMMMLLFDFLFLLITRLISLCPISKIVKIRNSKTGQNEKIISKK